MFAWLEPTVWKASTIAHLPVEQLPPLADYDDASHLIKTTFDVCLALVILRFAIAYA